MEDRMYITIAKVLQGEASAAEQREVDVWLAADKNNAAILAEMKASWSEVDVLLQEPRFDTAAAWEKVSAHMQASEEAVAPKKGRSMAFPAWAKYSSAIAAMLIIGLVMWNPFGSDTVRIAAADANRRIELPDHSIITLRKGSTFSYPRKFAARERNVSLQGEAFFEVARNEAQPFVIDAQSVSVTVLGTTFNVQCNERAANVAVTTGRVQVASRTDAKSAVVLAHGDKAHYESGRLTQSTANGYEASWKEDKLIFNGDPLSKVIAAIATAKDTSITLDASLPAAAQSQAVTITFGKESLEEMLTELCLITNCRWEKQGAAYLVRSK